MALLERSYLTVEEFENERLVYATLFVGVFCGSDFYGENLSFCNLDNKKQLVRIPAKDLKDISSGMINIIEDPYPTYSIQTNTRPENDERISVINKQDIPEIIVYAVEMAVKAHADLIKHAC